MVMEVLSELVDIRTELNKIRKKSGSLGEEHSSIVNNQS